MRQLKSQRNYGVAEMKRTVKGSAPHAHWQHAGARLSCERTLATPLTLPKGGSLNALSSSRKEPMAELVLAHTCNLSM